MSFESIIISAIEKVVARKMPIQVTVGTVTAVDKDKRTVDVERDSLPEMFDVRLNAVTSPTGVLTIYPTKGSYVLVAIIDNNPVDAFVLTCTDVDEIVFNNGEYGGLLKVDAIVSEIQAVKDDLNAIKTAFTNWVTMPNDGGAALKAAAASWAGQQLPDVDATALQNEKFKH